MDIKRVHVVIVVRLDPLQYRGGAEINALKLGSWLSKDMKVSLVTSGKGTVLGKFFFIHRVGTIQVKTLVCLSFAVGTAFTILRLRPSLVHLQTAELSSCLVAILMKILRIPVLLGVTGSDVNLYRQRHFIDRLAARIAFRLCDVVLCLTEDLRRKTLEIQPRTNVIVIPSGVETPDTSPFSAWREVPTVSKRFVSLKSQIVNQKVILYVGSIRPIKGLQYLVGAFARVHRKIPSAALLIVGDGNDRDRIEQLAERLMVREKIVFAGEIPHAEALKYYAIADVFVLPSLAEGLPTVVLEAYSAGLPVVATRVCGISEIVRDGVTGYLVAPRNEEELADRIERLLLDRKLAQSMGAASRSEARKYSSEDVVRRLERIYFQLVFPKTHVNRE